MTAMQSPLDRPNEKATDAYARVAYGKMGSLANPTEEYLIALRKYLYEWIRQVEDKIDLLAIEERYRKEAEEA